MKENITKSKLELQSLHERHIGLTEALSQAYYEAASVCLNRHHNSPIGMKVIDSDEVSEEVIIEFETPQERTLRAWANEIDTTELGAYGISLAVIEFEEELVAVQRAETLTGADWYVAPIGSDPDDLEKSFRLEVSGVDCGDISKIQSRLRQKVSQTLRGKSNLPAIASVVGFKFKITIIKKVSIDR